MIIEVLTSRPVLQMYDLEADIIVQTDASELGIGGVLLQSRDDKLMPVKGSYIEVYSGIEFPKHDFQFNYDTKCCVYVAIMHHSGLSYKMF